jgi:hypothetical protein
MSRELESARAMVANFKLGSWGRCQVLAAAVVFNGYYETETESPSSTNFEPAVKIMFQGFVLELESSFIAHSTGRRPALARRPPPGP